MIIQKQLMMFMKIYQFLNGEDALPEKELLEKDATVKIFEYSPLGVELKAQTDIAKN